MMRKNAIAFEKSRLSLLIALGGIARRRHEPRSVDTRGTASEVFYRVRLYRSSKGECDALDLSITVAVCLSIANRSQRSDVDKFPRLPCP